MQGPGSVAGLAARVRARGVSKVLVVTGSTVRTLPQFAGLLEALRAEGVACTVFSGVQANPTIENVEAARAAYLAAGCQGVIAFGGGSPMDCAKVAAARVTNDKPVLAMAGLFKLRRALPPLFAVPTTAGSGSEVTVAAVITDPARRAKFAVADPRLVPKVAVLDPELMAGLPPAVTAATGMDALTHAVEAYVGVAGTALTDARAEEAVRLVRDSLERAYRNGADMEARGRMALASFRAGQAFTKASVGYVHAVAHKLGGLYGVPHGRANAIVLPAMLDFYGPAARNKLARLATLCGLGAPGDGPAGLAAAFIAWVRAMNRAMDIPDAVAELRPEDIPAVAQAALAEGNPMYPVPRIMDRAQCEALLRGLLPR